MNPKEKFQQDWTCPKCRGRGALAQEVFVMRSAARFVPLPPDNYISVTCRLCGFTEFYNQSALEHCDEKAPAGQMLVEKTDKV